VNGDRGFSDVLQDLLGNLQKLVRSEVRLAKAEMREEATLALSAGVWMGLGVVIGLGAGMLLLWSIVFAVALVVPMWAAALLTGAVTAAIAGALILTGRQRLAHVRLGPDRAIDSIKEDVEWLRQSTR